MNRDFLKGLGIEDRDIIDKIMAENGKDIEKVKEDLTKAKAETESVKKQLEEEAEKGKKKLAEKEAELSRLKGSDETPEALKKAIEELKSEKEKVLKEHKAELEALKLDAALERKLTESGSINNKATKVFIDLKGVKLASDGSVEGLDDLIGKLKEGESTSFLFKGKSGPKGVTPADGSDQSDTKKSLSEMSYEDYVKQVERERTNS